MLIYDLGLHNGDDTAHYLETASLVVAVDANPSMIDAARTRFASEIQDRRLILLNVGISDSRGKANFYISDRSEWCSFDGDMSTRDGVAAMTIEIETVPFSEILGAYGTPNYLKIDIEGMDRVCIDDLNLAAHGKQLPQYLSFEACGAETTSLLAKLGDMGYVGFKAIDQAWGHRQTLRARTHALTNPTACKLRRGLRRIKHSLPAYQPMRGFPPGSTGPFGEMTHGRWSSLGQVSKDWTRYIEALGKRGAIHHGDVWFDFHAKLSDSGFVSQRIS